MDIIDSLYPAPTAQNGIIEVSTPSAFKRPRTNEHQVETEGSPLVEIVKVTQEPPRRSSRKITPRSLSMCSHKSAQKNTHKPNSKPTPGVSERQKVKAIIYMALFELSEDPSSDALVAEKLLMNKAGITTCRNLHDWSEVKVSKEQFKMLHKFLVQECGWKEFGLGKDGIVYNKVDGGTISMD